MKTVSLETARKLKEAGFPQRGSDVYYLKLDTWTDFHIEDEKTVTETQDLKHYDGKPVVEFCYSAPCACEILEQLPQAILKRQYKAEAGFKLTITMEDSSNYGLGWCVGYVNPMGEYQVSRFEKSLVEALAELYCWCKKGGYLR